VVESCGAYIGDIRGRQANRPNAPDQAARQPAPELRQFHQGEPFLKATSRFHSASPAQAAIDQTLRGLVAFGDLGFTNGAERAEP
jgi:hypothetical protein